MIYSATLNKNTGIVTYKDTLEYFSRIILKGKEMVFGDKFFKDFGKYLDKSKFPCDKIVLNPFLGYYDKFLISFKYQDKRIGSVQIEHDNEHGFFTPTYIMFEEEYKSFDMFKHIIMGYFDKYNEGLFKSFCKQNSIKYPFKTNVKVIFDDYTDYKKNGKQFTLEGTLNEVFDHYVTHNDRLKYCNGDYWRFNDKNIEKAFGFFIKLYKGNFFLDNAVKRGVIID